MKLWIIVRNMAEMLLLYQGAGPERENNKETQNDHKKATTTNFIFCSVSLSLGVGYMELQRVALIISF